MKQSARSNQKSELTKTSSVTNRKRKNVKSLSLKQTRDGRYQSRCHLPSSNNSHRSPSSNNSHRSPRMRIDLFSKKWSITLRLMLPWTYSNHLSPRRLNQASRPKRRVRAQRQTSEINLIRPTSTGSRASAWASSLVSLDPKENDSGKAVAHPDLKAILKERKEPFDYAEISLV